MASVLFIGSGYPPRGTGPGQVMRAMATGLVARGHTAVVLTNANEGRADAFCDKGVHVHRQPTEILQMPKSAAASAAALISRYSIDVVEGADHLGESYGLLCTRDRPRTILRLHSCNAHWMLHQSQMHYVWQAIPIAAALMKQRKQVWAEFRSIRLADALVSPSQRILDEMRKQRLRLPQHTAVIPNPYLPRRASPPPRRESSHPSILFVGRLDIGKGIAYLPQLLRTVAELHPDVRLWIAGGEAYAFGLGGLGAWLRQRFEAAGVADRVDWLGVVDPDGLARLYSSAWVQVVPSRWDTFPTVVLEGMAHGAPLVGSPHGGFPEMVAGTTNCIADPQSPAFAACVSSFLSDQTRRDTAGRQGADKVSRTYCQDAVVESYLRFVHAVQL